MANPHEIRVTIPNGSAIPDDGDATLVSALERVLEAQQDLVVRRASLMIEELMAKATNFASRWLLPTIGCLVAIAGWFFSMVGLIDALDVYFERFALELAVGVIHIAAGAALIYARQLRSRAST